MSEFDEKEFGEEKKQETNEPVNTPPTEENTTYHYVYKKANDTTKSNSGEESNVGQDNFNGASYYTPPINNENSETNVSEKKPKKKKNKTVITIVVIVAVCVVAAIIGIFAAEDAGKSNNNGTTSNDNSSVSQVETKDQGDVAKTDDTGNYTVAGIAEKCINSCVGITVYTESSNYGNFYNYGSGGNSSQNGEEAKSSEGSGILMLESNGKTYILTCAHVISDGTSFTVTTNDGEQYDATMVAYDSQTDIGVLSINATGLQIAEFADSSSTVLGEQVVAIGCPGGLEFMNSVTSGYVSALARPISSTIGYDTDCIQIDAAINPGNSGGALFNMQGQVIGVNSSKIAATEYEGIGFAIPSNTAIDIANSLIKSGYVEGRAKLGITYKNIETYQNASSILSALEQLGYKDATGTMVINEITDDSDLKNKDVKEYDMIVAVNGDTMTSTDVLTSVLSDSKPGDTITLTIARISGNKIDTFDVDCKLIESKG